MQIAAPTTRLANPTSQPQTSFLIRVVSSTRLLRCPSVNVFLATTVPWLDDDSSPLRFVVRSQCNVEHRERDGERVGGRYVVVGGWMDGWLGERYSRIDFSVGFLLLLFIAPPTALLTPLFSSGAVSFWHMFYFCKHFGSCS